jgi:hypothetical protein
MNCHEVSGHDGQPLAQSRRHDIPMQLLLRLSSRLVEELPKALLAALIPLVQILWQQYHKRGPAWRKAALRKTAIEMSEQLAVFPKFGDSASAELARRDLERELTDTLTTLANLSTSYPKATPHTGRRSWYVRWFLLYAPHGVAAWLVHGLFFINIVVVLLGIIGLSSSLQDPEIGYGVFGMAIFSLPAVGLQRYAQRLDERHRAATQVPVAVQTAGVP